MKFLKYLKFLRILVLAITCLLGAGLLLSSCDDDEGSTGEIKLNSFGPSPVMRGGQLRFIGTNLDKVSAITLPGGVEVSTFVTKSPTLLVIDVPDATVNGRVTLKTEQGNIETKTELGIAEPITIGSMSPSAVRPGAVLTIEGTYLNLVTEIVFNNKKSVTEFESQSQGSITVVVPDDAQTGTIMLLDGETIPNAIESDAELQVILPAVTSFSPNPVKAGQPLTITGTNLDLVMDITFAGSVRVASDAFESQTATQIVMDVPADANDGAMYLRPASTVEVPVEEALELIAPTVTNFTPNPGKNNNNITVTGTDLDLVTTVVFGGDKEGQIQGGRTATSIVVKVPTDATEGTITFNTRNKPVTTTTSLALVVPTITNIGPLSVNTIDNPSITITGTHLDLVKTIVFGGEGWTADIAKATSVSATSIQIPVTPGSISGNIKIITTNGHEVTSGQSLTIVPNVPNVTGPTAVDLGSMITLTGTNMNVIADIYFPGDVIATRFGAKTATSIQVFLPGLGIVSGPGKIKFVTDKNEIYWSPEIDFRGITPLDYYIFDDGVKNGWQEWGGWGHQVKDFNNSEQVLVGSKSIKVTFNDQYGAIQFGSPSAGVFSGYTTLSFRIHAPAPQNLIVQIGNNGDTYLSIPAGWSLVQVPIANLAGNTNVNELRIKNNNAALPVTLYIDEVGLKH